MTDLAKITPATLTNALRSKVLAIVSAEIRQIAVEAIVWFQDRPSAAGLDFELSAVKLAAHLQAVNATPDEVVDACLLLDKTIKFRPIVPDYLNAIEAIRSVNRRREFSRMRTFYPADELDGTGVVCLPEWAEEIGLISEEEHWQRKFAASNSKVDKTESQIDSEHGETN